MGLIRQAHTKPEVQLRKQLHRLGLRYRLHVSNLPGRPDIVLPKFRTVIFVHGCFWHRHRGCKKASSPSTNIDFWQNKFAANVRRDAIKYKSLQEAGWTVLVVWECELKTEFSAASRAFEIRELLVKQSRPGAAERTPDELKL